ncbi:telomerase-binding protein EST1A-like [Corticium candelabrum]|uniref:telomerase-binding protein EST1A-like n=1 Tax=Corticium candelabrum TaxID=121492 RepID=UPI002E38013E|nr:telomerase-binding protein EST1A-like [Corticium candelabrum]
MASRRPEKLPTVRVRFAELGAIASRLEQEVCLKEDQSNDCMPTCTTSYNSLTIRDGRSREQEHVGSLEDKPRRGMLSLPQGYKRSGFAGRVEQSLVQPVSGSETEYMIADHLSALEIRLSNLLSRNEDGTQVDAVMELQQQLKEACENVVTEQVHKAHSSDTLQLLWKSGYHQVIEWLRKSVGDSNILSTFLEDACQFYQKLITTIQEKSRFTIMAYNPLLTYSRADKRTRIAILLCHKCYMCLGDLARYQQQHHSIADFGLARKFYMKAQVLVPKNGLAYNQLAITAALAKRKLDAVYYYMRSLAVSQPFINAREKLMVLFEDARRRHKYIIEKQRETTKQSVKLDKKDYKRRQLHQQQKKFVCVNDVKEVWVFPSHTVTGDGQEVNMKETSSESKDMAVSMAQTDSAESLTSLKLNQLNKQVTARFILLHGLLFTKVAVDQFDVLLSDFLGDIQLLWSSAHFNADWQTVAQMTAMCLFSVWNASHMSGTGGEALKFKAETLGLSVAQVTLSVVTRLIGNYKKEKLAVILEPAVRFLPSLSVWADVFLEDHKTWLCAGRQEVQSFLSSFRKLLNCFLGVADPTDRTNHKHVILPVDCLLSGFVPLQEIHSKKVTRLEQSDSSSLTLQKLLELADLLCTVEPPLLSFNRESYEYVDVQLEVEKPVTVDKDQATLPTEAVLSGEESDDILEEFDNANESVEDEFDNSDENVELMTGKGKEDVPSVEVGVGELIARKRELAAQMAQQKKREEDIREIVERQRTQRQEQTQIQPKFLVPDTNCFIDRLLLIEQIAKVQTYTLAIPLVVFNELDGLAKGLEIPANVQQAEKVMKNAMASSTFITHCFKSKRQNVSLLTSSGNLLNTSTFRLQDNSVQGNNDDIILESSIQLNDRTRRQSKYGSIQKVVLLTDDRNLRVKALARNIAVCNIELFFKLARIV